MAGVTVDVDGVTETLRAFQGLEADLRRQANGELRQAAGVAARAAIVELQASAAGSGVPVAPRVATSARVKVDRLPVVVIGGRRRVGRRGGTASALVWGSEHGPGGDVNHFAVPASAVGYWIRPAVDRVREGAAYRAYRRAIVDIQRRWGLI